MAVPQPPAVSPYSPNSTDASWKAAKTGAIRDKWNTELGAALRAAKLAYDKIIFEQLDVALYVNRHGQWQVAADVDVAKIGAKKHYQVVVKPAIKALETAKSKADWAGRNLVISKAANTKAKQIAADLGNRLRQLKGITFTDYDNEKARLLRNFQFAFDNFDTSLTRVLGAARTFIQLVRATPTPATFNHGIQDAARGITQMIGQVDKLKKNGLDLGRPSPKVYFDALEDWAEGRGELADTASRRAVLAAARLLEQRVQAVDDWWG